MIVLYILLPEVIASSFLRQTLLVPDPPYIAFIDGLEELKLLEFDHLSLNHFFLGREVLLLLLFV